MTDKAKSKNTFVNPYHFIPLQDRCNKNIDYEDRRNEAGLMTGWIECEIKTETPIFIPNTTNNDFYKERIRKGNKEDTINSYDFHSRTDNNNTNKETNNPIIPGSSIRGMLRSAFEILTNSCLSTTDDNHVLYKRVTTPADPGRLVKENGKWMIVECEKFGIKNQDLYDKYIEKVDGSKFKVYDAREGVVLPGDYKDKEEVFVKLGQKYPKIKKGYYNTKTREKEKDRVLFKPFTEVDRISRSQTNECELKGYLHLGESFHKKHHESVFVETDRTHPVTKRDVENLLENYKLYQDKTVNQGYKINEHKGYRSNIKGAKNAKIDTLNGALIYYVKYKGKYYLSPAAIGREVFHNRLKDLLKKGDYSPCTSHDKLCPACALFGFAGQESKRDDDRKKNAIASRVRFTDATTDNPNFLNPVILPELAGPKPSATELYMKKPNGKNVAMWNYDYAVTKQGRETSTLGVYQPQIQGRKMYWHQESMKTFLDENKRYNNREKISYSDRLVKVRPVDKDVNFEFKVHFNQVTEHELKQLLWALSIGGKRGMAHKIGMGKPVGLGSIKVSINGVKERKIELSPDKLKYEINSRDIEFSDSDLLEDSEGASEKTIKAFETMTNYEKHPPDVHYPYCVDKFNNHMPKNYEWFMGNKQIQGSGGKGTNHVISENLRTVLSGDYSLSVIKKDKKFYSFLPESRHIQEDKSPTTSRQVHNTRKPEKSEIDIEIEKLTRCNAKDVRKILKKLHNGSLKPTHIDKIEQVLKKRPDYENKYDLRVEKYRAKFESIKARIK